MKTLEYMDAIAIAKAVADSLNETSCDECFSIVMAGQARLICMAFSQPYEKVLKDIFGYSVEDLIHAEKALHQVRH